MRRAGEILCSQRYDLVICDEINVAFQLHLLTEEQLMGLVPEKASICGAGIYRCGDARRRFWSRQIW